MDIKEAIARSIKDADKRYFFEDYMLQAEEVLYMLKHNNLMIVPKEPTDAMILAGKDAITEGKSKPAEVVKAIYAAMIAARK